MAYQIIGLSNKVGVHVVSNYGVVVDRFTKLAVRDYMLDKVREGEEVVQ